MAYLPRPLPVNRVAGNRVERSALTARPLGMGLALTALKHWLASAGSISAAPLAMTSAHSKRTASLCFCWGAR
jgi:hypothetical protein